MVKSERVKGEKGGFYGEIIGIFIIFFTFSPFLACVTNKFIIFADIFVKIVGVTSPIYLGEL